MKSLVVFMDLNVPTYYIPLLLAIRKINPNIQCILVGNTNYEHDYYFKKLKKSGVLFIDNKEFKHCKNYVYFLDSSLTRLAKFNKRVNDSAIKITYIHASDIYTIPENSYHICVEHHQYKTAIQEAGGEPLNSGLTFISHLNTEVFLGGYFHYFEVIPYVNKDKKVLQKKIEEKLNIRLNPDLPVISYTTGEVIREIKLNETLEFLAQFYNVIIKDLPPAYKTTIIPQKNIFFCSSRREPLLRFASDVNIVPIQSGSLKSSFIFGLRTIPVYSYYTGKFYGKIGELLFEKECYTNPFLHSLSRNNYQYEYFKIVPPISIYNPERIKELIDNKVFWKRFDKDIEEIKKKVFGEVILKDAVTRTANYIIDILSR